MSYDLIQEEVPGFVRRIGDWVAQGSNNALIVLGTDRAKKGPASIDDGLGSVKSPGGGKSSGSALVVVGRKDKDGNPDLDKDSAYLYLSMNTDGDASTGSVMEGDAGKGAYGIMKSDGVRVIGRRTAKIVGGKGYMTIKDEETVVDNKKIKLGKNASVGTCLTDMLENYLKQLVASLATGTTPTGGPVTFSSPIPTPPSLQSKRTFVDAG
jgi:hypothetical protein